MNMVKRMSKRELLKIYKNNYELMLKRKNELYDKNIELQKKNIEKDTIISELKKEKKVLKAKLTKATKELKKQKAIEIAPSVEKGNKIIEKYFEKENNNEQ